MQRLPWQDETAPWEDEDKKINDEPLKNIYMANAAHILSESQQTSSVSTLHNFPTRDLEQGIVAEVLDAVTSICKQQKKSFKINISFGLMLKNREDGHYRYFIPDKNEIVFDRPFTISRSSDINCLKHSLVEDEVVERLRTYRESTKWEVTFITNFIINVTELDYPLGQGFLPKYIKDKKSIISLEKDSNQKVYEDNLCFFMCLALHYGCENIEDGALACFLQWMDYAAANNLKGVNDDPMEFGGMQLDQIPYAEKCILVNITLMELLPTDVVSPIYHAAGSHQETMFVNMHKHHLSYVTDFKAYARKFQCNKCHRHVHRCADLRRHIRVCSATTKMKFPGGFFKNEPNLFEEMNNYGVHVAVNDHEYPFYAVFDMESMLLDRRDINQNGKLQWVTLHQPVSVSVCSNVPGHEHPHCIVNTDIDVLLKGVLLKTLSAHYASPGRLAKHKRQLERMTRPPGDDPASFAIELETLA